MRDGTHGEGEDERGGTADRGRRIDRRTFVLGAGVLTGAAAADALAHATGLDLIGATAARVSRAPGHALGIMGLAGVIPPDQLLNPNFTLLLRRREDFLWIQVNGYNLKRSGQSLVRARSGSAWLVFTFGPQHVVEEAFHEDMLAAQENVADPLFDTGDNDKVTTPGNAHALLAGPSRIAFEVPSGLKSIPYTVAGLLDWSKLAPSLAITATSNNVPFFIGPPSAKETSIELPWHLALSPGSSSSWSHPSAALSAGGWTELWHTRLAESSDARAVEGGPVRAVWNFDMSPDFGGVPAPNDLNPPPPKDTARDVGVFPYKQALTQRDRWDLVHATTDGQVPGRADVQASRLWLSARGGSLDARGAWNIPDGNPASELAAWRHEATAGRDQHVVVVLKGFLFPFGHKVTLTIVTERQFQQVGSGNSPDFVGAFRQYDFIKVVEPFKSYDPAVAQGIANDSRDFPFRNLTLTTRRTPFLDSSAGFAGLDPGAAFAPSVSGSPFRWHFVGTDWVGRQVAFTVGAVFVLQPSAQDSDAATVRDAYNKLAPGAALGLRTADLQGQTIAFGPQHKPGDTDLRVQSITFGAAPGGGSSQAFNQKYDLPDCAPTLALTVDNVPTGAQAAVRLTAAEQMSGGGQLGGNSTPAFAYHPPYVTNPNGFGGANQGNVFLKSVGQAGNLVFGSGSGGGLMTPNIGIDGLSRSLGPVADAANMFGGTFDPSSFFKDLDSAQFLGGLSLGEIIAVVNDLGGAGGSSADSPNAGVPQLSYTTAGTVVTTNVHWQPTLSSNDWIRFNPGGDIVLDGTITTDLAAAPPGNSSFAFNGSINNFVFSLMQYGGDTNFIDVTFDSITFNAASHQKTSVRPSGISVAFAGPLTFLNQLEDLISFTGDGGGPQITVDSRGVTADLTVSLPPVEGAFFTLAGLSFEGGVNIPLDGVSMTVFSFGFASQDNPFTIAAGIFGGGGYFYMEIGTKHIKQIQVSLDFGGMMALNIVVASGSVSLTASITYTMNVDAAGHESCQLVATVKLDGHLSVLGIVSLSLEFDLTLTWNSPNELTGTVTMSVGISIFGLSASVTMTASKTFTGGGSSSSSVSGGAGSQARRLTAPQNSGPPLPWTFGQQMSQTDWASYCNAFETA